MAEFAVVKNGKGRYEIRKTWNTPNRPDLVHVRWWGKRGMWVDDWERDEGVREDPKIYGSKQFLFQWTAKKEFKKVMARFGRNPNAREEVEVIHASIVPDPEPIAPPGVIGMPIGGIEAQW